MLIDRILGLGNQLAAGIKPLATSYLPFACYQTAF